MICVALFSTGRAEAPQPTNELRREGQLPYENYTRPHQPCHLHSAQGTKVLVKMR